MFVTMTAITRAMETISMVDAKNIPVKQSKLIISVGSKQLCSDVDVLVYW